ncbi:hypothetical protein [Pontibacter sp. SGAir0037]|uniref:hypothetical protein n=1 Tax=Pontibacter sp. SGAir0037 TaxID=2571030 RepID=UPI0010CD61AF|nr:hypothetical protein [Pontibacter sp. SGAir0037]QCR24428.1 hypothetical protein C1N53_20085 [Pontibacter sp. SGAir0037]
MLYTLAFLCITVLQPQQVRPGAPEAFASALHTSIKPDGASTLDELGNRLLDALSAGSSDELMPYVLNQQAYERLQKQSSAQVSQTLELTSPETLVEAFQSGFKTVIAEGVSANINWSQVSPGGVEQQKAAKAQQIIPAVLLLSDQNNRQIKIDFEAVEVSGRYYFFRQMRLATAP